MFSVNLEKNENGVTLAVVGRFDFNHTQQFMEVAQSPEAKAAKELCIDFRETLGLDSSAIGCLLMLNAGAQQAGQSIILTNAFGHVDAALKVAKLDKLFTII